MLHRPSSPARPFWRMHLHSARARCAQALNFLRYGCLPVFVMEGDTPSEKHELLRQR